MTAVATSPPTVDVEMKVRVLRQQLMFMKKGERQFHKVGKTGISNPFDLVKGKASMILDQIYTTRDTAPKRFDLTKYIKAKESTPTESATSPIPSPRSDRGRNARPWREKPEGLRPLPRIITPSPEPPASPVSERPWREKPIGLREQEIQVTRYLTTMDGKVIPNPQAYAAGVSSRCPRRHILVDAKIEGEMDVFLVGGRTVCSVCKERTPILSCLTCCPHYHMCKVCSANVDGPTASEMAPIVTTFDKIVSRALSPSSLYQRRVSTSSSRGSVRKVSSLDEASPSSINSSDPKKSDVPDKTKSRNNLSDLFDSDDEQNIEAPQFDYNVEPDQPPSPSISRDDLSDCG